MGRRNIIKEFFRAVSNRFSYRIRDNIYIWFGICWGLPIPFVTLFIEVHHLSQLGMPAPVNTALQSPIQWFFIAHPIIFGIVFGVLGTIRLEKDKQLEGVINQLSKLSSLDSLTGLKNRRYFTENFRSECERSGRRNELLFLLFLDLDHFKRVNDQHGHNTGDIVLKDVATLLKRQCRPYDIPVRWGGEEFLILFRTEQPEAAAIFAERIREKIAAGEGMSVNVPITISIGISKYQENDTLETLADRADKALYTAKESGRNCVVSWPPKHSSLKNND
ncbi:MAG: GGDEF domain-containing protein [Desulfobulbaceae bacterium]|nr:MAG: GGDEF domain-containing protein [Desulfobulbaceae bacterium]